MFDYSKVPPYSLACLETDNCFSAPGILIHWKYIYTECNKHIAIYHISVISYSFGSDKQIKTMKLYYMYLAQ